MSNTKNSVQARIKNLSQKISVNVNTLLASYFFDAFLLRLSKSEYRENFILKGGFYLSAIFGIQNRYTQDLDFKLTGQNFAEMNVRDIIEKIVDIQCNDEISFDLTSISPILDEDAYGGFSVVLVGHLENIRQQFTIDIATGNPITPTAVTYKYKRLLEETTIDFKAYNLETILAEKIQTIFKRGLLNSRSKDFYDVYIIKKLRLSELNINNLKAAFQNTCKYRETCFSKNEAVKLLESLSSNEQFVLRWKNYVNKNSFAKDIRFGDVIKACKVITEFIF